MSRLFRVLTAVVFAVHLMVGCCAHRAHACEGKDDMQPAHGQCPDGHDGGTDNSHRGPHDCQWNQCSFVASSSPSSHSFVQPSQAFFTALLTDQPSLVGTGTEQHCFTTGRLLMSVHLYLVNQVLLV
jgi:hypothetical protein